MTDMDPIDLFDILGGRDNLRLMCEAGEFYVNEGKGFVRFTLRSRYVWLTKCLGGYGVYVWDVETGTMLVEEVAGTDDQVRWLFERYTGYSLNF